MSENEKDQWYTNKDLFEQIMALQQEMRETRAIIKKYNGLYEKVHDVQLKVQRIENETIGKNKVREGIRLWGGWIFSLITLVILLYNEFL